MCQAELGELGDVARALEERGGTLLAISVDPSDVSRKVVARNELPFRVLADVDRRVVSAYGLLHAGAAPDGSDIAIPAHVLIERGGRIVWKRVSKRVQDRPEPSALAERIRAL